MPTPQLRSAMRKFDDWERGIEEAHDAIKSVPLFFTRENLGLLSIWIPERSRSRKQALAARASSEEFLRLSETHA